MPRARSRGCEALMVSDGGVGAGVEQCRVDLHLLLFGGVVQRSLAVGVLGIDVVLAVGQQRQVLIAPVLHSEHVQRCASHGSSSHLNELASTLALAMTMVTCRVSRGAFDSVRVFGWVSWP